MVELTHKEMKEFVYDNEKEREDHIKTMDKLGWKVCGNKKRLKSNVSVLEATEDDYEWYGLYIKFKYKK